MTDDGTFTIGDTGLRVVLHDRLVIVAGNGMTDYEVRLCMKANLRRRGTTIILVGCQIDDIPIYRVDSLSPCDAFLVDVKAIEDIPFGKVNWLEGVSN